MNSKIAVAMSVYKTDCVEYFRLAVDSILNQNYQHFHLYIAVDGFVGKELLNTIEKYSVSNKVTVIYNNENKGLALRLNQIINQVLADGEFNFLARMDSDDISTPERFKKQVDFLNSSSSIDVVGSDVIEISASGKKVFYKKMDTHHNVILDNVIKKCPFNHPTVMFRTSIFHEGFRYKSELLNTQDYYLWVDLLAANKQFANINEPLLEFRVDDSFHQRRGLKKAINDLNARIYAFKNLNNLNFSNLLHTAALFILRVSPPSIKKIAYEKFR